MVIATEFLSQTTLRFVLLGMATGALTALVALSIVIVYRVSGVLNFAAAALGAVGAFICYSLRDDHGWPTPLALGAGLLVGVALGIFTYVLMAALRQTSLLARLIATLALLTAAQSAMLVIWSNQVSAPSSLLPDDSITIAGDIRITQDRLILIGIVLVLAVALRFVYSGTLFGLATSAVAENRRVAAIARWAPSRIEFVNYAIAGLLSALAAILLAPIVGLNAAILSITILPALAAALVGRFSSFALTVIAALGIGIIQSELSLYQPDLADFFSVSTASLTGLTEAVPLIIILVVTVFSGRARPTRGEMASRLPLPGSGQVARIPLAIGLVAAAVLIVAVPSYADALIVTFGLGIIIASVVVVSGYAGQLSLCQYALAGFGAWAAAKTANSFDAPFLVAIVVGVLVATVIGVLVALPAVRTRGVTLAIVTLALSLVFSAIVFQNASLTGGFSGIKVRSPEIFGFDIDSFEHPQRYAAVMLLALAAVSFLVANIRRGASGRRMIAVRSNERAAAGLGISVIGVKLFAFAVGAGIAALGGILLTFRQTNVQFGGFDVFSSILLVQYAVIGGLGWISGVVLGASAAPGAISTRITNDLFPNLDNVAAWIAIFSAVGVVQLLRRAPDGVASLWAEFGRRVPLLARRRAVVAAAAISESDESPLTARELEVRGVSVSFGGVKAVDDVSFNVTPGEVVGLIGPNGAGKTTLLDVISGFTRQQSGRVLLDGKDVSTWSPERRARSGIVRSWQGVELFEELTVRDNLLVADDQMSTPRYLRDLVWPGRSTLSSYAESVVDDLGLRAVLDERPTTLSHGMIKLVGIARTIVSNPSIVLLDEPAAGLDRDESRELTSVIRHFATRHGVAVVIIEHDMALILNTCDRIVALDFGRVIADGTPREVQTDELVIRAYLGEPIVDPTTPTPTLSAVEVDAS